MAKESLEDLIADGTILRGTDVDVAQAPLGLAVRAGAPHPDISSVERFKQLLLEAKVVTFPFSTTGMYLRDRLFPRMGIASEMSRW
jgi:molybdate transport system substrate-binding protein